MKNLFFVVIAIIFFMCCSENKNSITSKDYREFAHGNWKAYSGDIKISNEIGLIVYNTYAIDTRTNTDSVFVTWDNGIGCTTLKAIMSENIIEFIENDINTKITIKNKNEATIAFKTENKQYEKELEKTKNTPSIICE